MHNSPICGFAYAARINPVTVTVTVTVTEQAESSKSEQRALKTYLTKLKIFSTKESRNALREELRLLGVF
jgi:hypothetical protein